MAFSKRTCEKSVVSQFEKYLFSLVRRIALADPQVSVLIGGALGFGAFAVAFTLFGHALLFGGTAFCWSLICGIDHRNEIGQWRFCRP